jgi:hypothetical protein
MIHMRAAGTRSLTGDGSSRDQDALPTPKPPASKGTVMKVLTVTGRLVRPPARRDTSPGVVCELRLVAGQNTEEVAS